MPLNASCASAVRVWLLFTFSFNRCCSSEPSGVMAMIAAVTVASTRPMPTARRLLRAASRIAP